MSDYLDPATLTPESLYRLQSDTWAQGADYERERIVNLIKQYKGKPDFTLDNLIYMLTGETHPPQQFRDRSNGE